MREDKTVGRIILFCRPGGLFSFRSWFWFWLAAAAAADDTRWPASDAERDGATIRPSVCARIQNRERVIGLHKRCV